MWNKWTLGETDGELGLLSSVPQSGVTPPEAGKCASAGLLQQHSGLCVHSLNNKNFHYYEFIKEIQNQVGQNVGSCGTEVTKLACLKAE